MAGYRTWANDDDLSADDINDYLVGQVVCRFTDVVERDAQMGGAVEGQICYVIGVGFLRHDGTDWGDLFALPPAPTTSYAYTQTVPGTVWTITHNLGFDPAGVLVFIDGFAVDEYGVQILVPGVSLRLSFDNSVVGVANLS
jgi:hypothetical protein